MLRKNGRWTPAVWRWDRDAAYELGAAIHKCGARNGALEFSKAALEPRCCMKIQRRHPPVQRWNFNAASEWGAGMHRCSAGTAMLHKSGVLESTSAALEL